MADVPKPLRWVGGSKNDLLAFPAEIVRNIGYALHFAQMGDKHPSAKPLKGFGGAGVLEVVEDFAGDAYRVVYTVRFRHAVYVLHAFRKKAKRGIVTPAREIEMVRTRLRRAAEMDEQG
jgi:phage-related protein